MRENEFWKMCEALDCKQRIELLRFLLVGEKTDILCVNELAARMVLSSATVSVHLKKLATVGLVVSKRANRRIYYHAFATTGDGVRVLEALHTLSLSRPSEERLRQFRDYAHALSHVRRNAIARCLHVSPGLSLKELSRETDMPLQTAARLLGDLVKAHIVDLSGMVVAPEGDPEATLLELTLA